MQITGNVPITGSAQAPPQPNVVTMASSATGKESIESILQNLAPGAVQLLKLSNDRFSKEERSVEEFI